MIRPVYYSRLHLQAESTERMAKYRRDKCPMHIFQLISGEVLPLLHRQIEVYYSAHSKSPSFGHEGLLLYGFIHSFYSFVLIIQMKNSAVWIFHLNDTMIHSTELIAD